MSLSITLRPKKFLQTRFADWVTRRQPVATRDIIFDRRHIYIMPTAYGYYFAALLILMLLAAMNYNNSMAFVLTFLLAGLGNNAIWNTHRNLLNLRVIKGSSKPVFAGDTARFELTLQNTSSKPRHAVVAQWQDCEYTLVDVPANNSVPLELKMSTNTRGRIYPGRFRVYTRYPLGLFQAWSWPSFDMSVLVYPKPLKSSHTPPNAISTQAGNDAFGTGHDDYAGLRNYQLGDSPKHIAWKAFARYENLHTKQFSGDASKEIWLEWDALEDLETELKLSILCQWALDMQERGERYGLRMPGIDLQPDMGDEHDRRCLEALALYGLDAEPIHK